jgi:quercetin dioxygenase-like cupin family protein
MRISRARRSGQPSQQRTETFTGTVWGAPVLDSEQDIMVNDVLFEPGARTHWHTHTIAQVLLVTHGEGFIKVRGGAGARLLPGDVVHIPADEEHWHGATPDTLMLHTAVSVGSTVWLEPVSSEDYHAALREGEGEG